MLRIFEGRSLLIRNYLNYSSIPDKLGKAKDSSKNELIFLKKEDEIPITTIAQLKLAAPKEEPKPKKKLKITLAPLNQKIPTKWEKINENFNKTCQFILKNLKVNRSYDEIPGPVILKTTAKIFKIIPFIGLQTSSALLEFVLFSENFFHFFKITSPSYYLRQEFGKIIHLPGLLGGNFVLLTHPDYLQLVLNNENNLRSCFDSLDHYSKKTLKNQNLFSVKENLDKYLTTEPSVHSNIHTATIDFIERIKKSRDKDDEVPNSFSEDINRWSLECIWSVIFSTKTDFFDPVIPPEQHLFMDSLKGASSAVLSCEKGFQLWRLVDTKNWIQLSEHLKAIDSMIEKHVCKKVNLFVGGLLKSGLSKDEIALIVREIFIVGFTLSSSALPYILKNLAKNPTKQQQLFDEIMKVFPDKDSKITEESIKSIPFLNGFILESLRVDSPIKYLKRTLDQDLKIENFSIPRNTQLFVAHQTSNSSNEFFENAQNFEPDRWLDKKLSPWTGLGCIEGKLIELQLSIVLVHILKNFVVEFNHGEIGSGRFCVAIPSKPLKFAFIDRCI